MSTTATTKLTIDPTIAELVLAVRRVATMEESLRKRRATNRFTLNSPVPISTRRPTGHFKPELVAWGQDISVGGIGIISEQPLTKGGIYWANLRTFGKEHYVFQCRVLFCIPLVGKMHRIGAEFIGTLNNPAPGVVTGEPATPPPAKGDVAKVDPAKPAEDASQPVKVA
jgi:hypothetical protein